MQVVVNGRSESVLLLPIKQPWYDMILSGEKKEEYRTFNSYYMVRLRNHGLLERDGETSTGKARIVMFRNGYSAKSPSFLAKCTVSVHIGGRPEWGAEQGVTYYVLEIREVIKEW